VVNLIYSLLNSSVHMSILARTLGAAIMSAFLVWAFTPSFIRLLKRKGLCEQTRDFGVLNAPGKAGTPTAGGMLLFGAIAASSLVWCKLTTAFVWVPLMAGAALGAVGFVDDLWKIRGKSSEAGVSRKVKYAAQFAVGAAVALLLLSESTSPVAAGETRGALFLPFIQRGAYLGWLMVPWLMVFMVAASNSVNLTDGMDGLATVPVIFVALVLGAFGYITGRVDFAEHLGYFPVAAESGETVFGLADAGELMVLAAAVAGAAVGFLWYNAHPAAIFMGDTGSMALGGLLGSMAAIGKQEFIFFIAGGLFVLECASGFIQDYIGLKLLGRRIFFRAPLHTNMLHSGTAETKVTVRLWIVSGLFAVIALCTMKLR